MTPARRRRQREGRAEGARLKELLDAILAQRARER